MLKLFVIGIGYKPLGKRAREIILNSETILTSSRLLDVFARYEEYGAVMDRVKVINNIDGTIDFMKSALHDDGTSVTTLLASGDPLFYGIGRRVLEEIGKDMVEIIPELSSVQLAFACIKEPWDDALLISLHGGPDPNRRRKLEYRLQDLPSLLAVRYKIAILTDKVNNPTVIAQTLLDAQRQSEHIDSALKLYVCEKLGYPDEKITGGTASEIASQSFADPNVVIIIRATKHQELGKSEIVPHDNPEIRTSFDSRFGLTENAIIHSRGLITKDEVRAVALHKLQLPETGVFWDIGAGSGSVSLEAARLFPGLSVFAIERDEEQINNITANRERFQVPNTTILHGPAPEALTGLPSPDRVFIGGSGGSIGAIIEMSGNRMKSGIIVVNAATVETLNLAAEALRRAHYSVEVCQISVSRMKAIGDGHFFSALNPVFVIKGEK
jgi:precorrin-6Y C5,15-methyltransferase (decarboxylating)